MDISQLLTAFGETMLMTIVSTVIAYIIGFPLGVILSITAKNGIKPNPYINKPLGIFVNIMRSIPCLLLIVILLPITRGVFGRGTGNWYTMLIPLIFGSFGFIARIVETSLTEVDNGVIEASKSMGASTYQIITKVLLIEARPSLVSGLTVTLINIIGLTAFAYDFGAGGLISIAYSYYSNNTRDYLSGATIWVVLICIVLLVQLIQESGLFISKKIDKRRK